ncbi:MAG: hypothetical protein WCP57_05550 [Bacteroidota bacterium]|jgi:hypothetical protein
MKKFISLCTIIFACGILTSQAAIFLKYYNGDSNDAIFKVKTCGSTTEVKFDHSTTSTVTIQTGCSDAVIITSCGEVTVKDNMKVSIKNGCIKIEN